ncbi:hypothetical protein AB6D11_19260 [Vibrio splendidus]
MSERNPTQEFLIFWGSGVIALCLITSILYVFSLFNQTDENGFGSPEAKIGFEQYILFLSDPSSYNADVDFIPTKELDSHFSAINELVGNGFQHDNNDSLYNMTQDFKGLEKCSISIRNVIEKDINNLEILIVNHVIECESQKKLHAILLMTPYKSETHMVPYRIVFVG